MHKDSYFGKIKTGGANSSLGLSFQDSCAIYYLLKNLDNSGFLSVGIETDDDFTLIYEHEKLLLQVKLEELSLPLAIEHVGENKILIGSTINKKLSSFLTYLKHYRNFESSEESEASKTLVSQDFEDLLLKFGFTSALDVPRTWFVDTVPEGKVEEIVNLHIVSWGISKGLFIHGDNCMRDFQLLAAKKRAARGFITKQEAIALLHKHSKQIAIEQGYVNSIGIKKETILEKVETKITHAETLLREKDYDRALKSFTELAGVLESEQIYVKCAAILHILDQHDEAITYCNKALDIDPCQPYALAIKGSSLGEKGDYLLSLDFLKSANHYNPDDAVILYNLGVAYLKVDKIDEAIDHFEFSTYVDKKFSSPHLNLGVCLYKKGQFSAALEHIEICLLLEPGLPEALSQKGEIKRFYGEIEEAQELFSRCLKKTPDNHLAQRGLAFCLLETGDPLGVPMLIRNMSDELNVLAVNEILGFFDIGWKNTLALSIKRIDESSYAVEYNNLTFFVSGYAKDTIAVGTLNLEVGRLPVIIKTYERLNDYKNAVNCIRLGQDFDLVYFVSGLLTDHQDHCEIRIEFKHLTIQGETGRCNNEGFNSFKGCYEGYYLLLLQHGNTNQKALFNLVGLEIK